MWQQLPSSNSCQNIVLDLLLLSCTNLLTFTKIAHTQAHLFPKRTDSCLGTFWRLGSLLDSRPVYAAHSHDTHTHTYTYKHTHTHTHTHTKKKHKTQTKLLRKLHEDPKTEVTRKSPENSPTQIDIGGVIFTRKTKII